MKIKRYVAPDMRQAMREVREEQGADAVILSTRRVDEGIEVVAAVDYDEALVRQAVRPPAPTGAPSARVERPATPPAPTATAAFGASATALLRRAMPPATAPARPVAAPAAAPAAPRVPATPRVPVPPVASAPVPRPVDRAVRETEQLREEMGDLRALLEVQLSGLAWNDLERRRPLRARVLRELSRMGIEPDVARALAGGLPEQISPEQARYLPLGMLSRSVAVSGRSLAGDDSDIIALVGPTGVGKTTTLAKLAARAVMRHGANRVALVSTDHYRIGAAAQLEHYGRLLGVQVHPAYDVRSLRKVLDMLRGRQTVLIDTAGMATSDPRLAAQLEVLAGAGELRLDLVLAANTQPQSMEESLGAYRALKPQACILTKLDEAPSLGGALSVLIRHRLLLDYTTDGQRVPEDIAVADARTLVCRAAQSLKADIPDDSMMAERFGLTMAEV